MAEHVIKKRGKYLRGHSYCSGFGYQFHWSTRPEDARKFVDGVADGALEMLRQLTKGAVISVDAELLTKQPLERDRS